MHLIKKISIILVFMILFNFTTVYAGIGGKLLNPVMSLLVTLADGAMALLQKVVIDNDSVVIKVEATEDSTNLLIDVASMIGTAICVWGLAALLAIPTGGTSFGLAIAWTASVAIGVFVIYPAIHSVAEDQIGKNLYLPTIGVSPREIFSGEIPLLDVDFFNPMIESTQITDSSGEKTTNLSSTAVQLRPTISKWYKTFREIAIVALLSILIYIGIRILISSTSNDKAKYKQLLVDWVVALCLLFIMHYIMSFSNFMNKKILNMLDAIKAPSQTEVTNIAKSELKDLGVKKSEQRMEIVFFY